MLIFIVEGNFSGHPPKFENCEEKEYLASMFTPPAGSLPAAVDPPCVDMMIVVMIWCLKSLKSRVDCDVNELAMAMTTAKATAMEMVLGVTLWHCFLGVGKFRSPSPAP